MAGYTRQSTADIIPTATVRSAPVNAEFNAVRDAFTFDTGGSTGHKHDGSSDEGSYVPLIADLDGLNKIVVDTSNNRHGFFVEVSSTAVEQFRVQDGAIIPVTTNDIDLGTSSLEFKDLYLDGTAKVDTLTVDENATVAGTLGVTGLSTLAAVNGTTITASTGFVGDLTGDVTGNITGDVVGNATLSTVTVSTSITVPAPTGDTQASTKKYVDDQIAELEGRTPGTYTNWSIAEDATDLDFNFSSVTQASLDSSGNLSVNGLTIGGTAVTATAAELNALDGITATTAELNLLDGVTATTAEINYLDGVTSNIQTQLDSVSVTNATLDKSFISGETATISLSQAITSGAPVVSVTKEVPQTGVTNNSWDVATTGVNYDRQDSAYSTTLTPTLGDYGNVADYSYNDASLNVNSQDISPRSVAFNSDGTKMYMVGSGNDSVYQYTLSTAWDLSTASYDSVSFSVSAQDSNPYDVAFKSDGTKMYIVGLTSDSVYQYTLSTAWDLSTASYDSVSFSVSAQDTPYGIFFKSDGTKMYMMGNGSDSVYQYSLSTAWDLSTASYDSVFFIFSYQDASPISVAFNSDGTKMYMLGSSSAAIYQYSLSTAWNVGTASYTGTPFSFSNVVANTGGFAFKDDQTKLYLVGSTSDTVYEFVCEPTTTLALGTGSFSASDVGKTIEGNGGEVILTGTDGSCKVVTAFTDYTTIASGDWSMYNLAVDSTNGIKLSGTLGWDVSTASYDSVSFSVGGEDTQAVDIFFKDDGTKMYMLGAGGDSVYQYTLSTAWDPSTASYDSVYLAVGGQDSTPTGIFFKGDGTKMYMVGSGNDLVHQYTLSTAWDLSTASYDSVSFSVASQDTSPTDIFFKSDGTKMYMVGLVSDRVYQYSLSTAWDVSTASYDSVSLAVTSLESQPYSIAFKSDGTKLYMIGVINDTVYQYSLSTAWDLSTITYDSVSFSVSSQEATPNGIFFKGDGTKMYMVGPTSDSVYQYTLSTAWDVGTATYDSVSFSFTGLDAGPRSVSFKDDGTKMYILGLSTSAIYQYSLSTAWDPSTASYDSVSLSVSAQDTNSWGLFFKGDGTKMYMVGYGSASVYQYTLSTAWDLSTASYDTVSFSVVSQDSAPRSVFFKGDGTKMYVIGDINDTVYQYTLSTAWDVSTASYDSVSFSVNSQESQVYNLFFKGDGTKMYVVGAVSKSIFQYTLSTAWNVGTASYNSVSFSVSAQDAPSDVFFSGGEDKVYVVGTNNRSVYRYTIEGYTVPTSQYLSAVTNAGGNIDTTYWTDINSMTVDEAPGDGEVYYAVSTDGRTTWKVIDDTNGERSIVRDNAGTWEYNSNVTYASTTWTSASTNTEFDALTEALSVAQNRMNKTQLEAVTDANHYTLGNDLDLMIALYLGSESDSTPTSDGVAINYDANIKNEGAVVGTDYDWDFPASGVVRVTSNATQNLKIRIV